MRKESTNGTPDWYSEELVTFELPDGSQRRITVGVCSEFDIATYRMRLGQAQDYLAETYGIDFLEASRAGTILNALGDHYHEWDTLREWSAMLSAFRKLERREGEEGEWAAEPMPDSWTKPATGLRVLPAVMFRGWMNLVNALNPGLFTVAQTDIAKKSVRLIAPSLTS